MVPNKTDNFTPQPHRGHAGHHRIIKTIILNLRQTMINFAGNIFFFSNRRDSGRSIA